MEPYVLKEYQDGTIVTVKDVQQIILEIAKVVDQLCDKHNIPYVINGGTLEHIFDVAKAMKNISDMVKPGGVVIHIVPFAGLANHGFYSFSPTFFLDYCEANSFDIINLSMEFLLDNGDMIFSQDCRIFDDNDIKINEYVKKTMQISEVECILLLCIAKKCNSKAVSYPIQSMYSKMYSACIERRDICY